MSMWKQVGPDEATEWITDNPNTADIREEIEEIIAETAAAEREKVEKEIADALEREDKLHLKNHDWAEAADFVRSGDYKNGGQG